MRRLAWAFAARLCDKYHNLMSWLISVFTVTYGQKNGSVGRDCIAGFFIF